MPVKEAQSRAKLEEVPPNAVDGNVTVEMLTAVARVGTASVPTYTLAIARIDVATPKPPTHGSYHRHISRL